MHQNKILIVLIDSEPTFNKAPSSRALYLFKTLQEYFPSTFLIMREGSGKECNFFNLITIKPVFSFDGKYKVFGELFSRLYISIYIILFILRNNIDTIIVRGSDTILIVLFSKLLRKKIIYDFHGLLYIEKLNCGKRIQAIFIRMIEDFVLFFSDNILVTTDGFKSQIIKYNKKCLYLPNGMDFEKFENAELTSKFLPNDKKVIGFIGNWEHDMNINDLCQSVNYLPDCIGLIIGDGHNTYIYNDEYKNDKKLIFMGRLEPEIVYSYLKKMDICVLPYDKNSKRSNIVGLHCARKTIEYLYAGKPIIVSNVPAKETFLIENINCLLYESGNPRDLSEKIKFLLNNKELYNVICMNNKKVGLQFSWKELVQKSGIIEKISGYISK